MKKLIVGGLIIGSLTLTSCTTIWTLKQAYYDLCRESGQSELYCRSYATIETYNATKVDSSAALIGVVPFPTIGR